MGRSRRRTDKDFIRQLALEAATEFLTLQIDDLRKVNPGRPGASAEVDRAIADQLERARRYINSTQRKQRQVEVAVPAPRFRG